MMLRVKLLSIVAVIMLFGTILYSQEKLKSSNSDSDFYLTDQWLMMVPNAGIFSGDKSGKFNRGGVNITSLSYDSLSTNKYYYDAQFQGATPSVEFQFRFAIKFNYLDSVDSLDIIYYKGNELIYKLRCFHLDPAFKKFPIRKEELLLTAKLYPFLHPYSIRSFLKKLKEDPRKREFLVKPMSYTDVKTYSEIYSNLNEFQKKFANTEHIHSLNVNNLESILIDPFGYYQLVIEMNGKILGSLRFEVTN